MGLIFRGTDDTIKADDGSLTVEGLGGAFPGGVEVGTAATIKSNGNATFSGIVTATSFVGDGTGLTGVASTDNIQTGTPAIFLSNVNISGASTVGNDATFNGNVSIGGSLTVDGTFTKINTTILDIEDKTVGVASTSAKTSATQDGAGLVIYGQTDVNFVYDLDKAAVGLNTALSVSGVVTATDFKKTDGSSVGGITTEALTGTKAVVTINLKSAQDHKVTLAGISTVDVVGGTEGDSHNLRIVNSGITTVGFTSAFLFPSGGVPFIPTATGSISLISFVVHHVGAAGTQLLAGASVNYS